MCTFWTLCSARRLWETAWMKWWKKRSNGFIEHKRDMALYAELLLYSVEPLVNSQSCLYAEHCMRDALYLISIHICVVVARHTENTFSCHCHCRQCVKYHRTCVHSGQWLVDMIFVLMRTHICPPEANWQIYRKKFIGCFALHAALIWSIHNN